MIVKIASVLIGTLVLLQNVNGYSGSYKCGPSEQAELCAAPATVVRPKPLVNPPITRPLFRSYDNKGPCFRKQAIVTPAVVPHPVYIQSDVSCPNNNICKTCGSKSSTCVCSSNTHSNQHYTNSGSDGIDVSRAYEQACTDTKSSAPADAVSLALAYKNSQSCYSRADAERRLAFGSSKMPIDMPVRKRPVCKTILPEKNLYAINGQVVELKASNCGHTSYDSLSGEAEEELLDLAMSEEARDVQTFKGPRLTELGYGPVGAGSTSFVNVPSVPIANNRATAQTPSVTYNDGFKAGTVEYKSVGKIDTECDSQEEDDRHTAPTCSCNYNGNTSGLGNGHHRVMKSSSSSCSSSRHHQKSHVAYEKLCH